MHRSIERRWQQPPQEDEGEGAAEYAVALELEMAAGGACALGSEAAAHYRRAAELGHAEAMAVMAQKTAVAVGVTPQVCVRESMWVCGCVNADTLCREVVGH
jgi:hypothetical protein